MNLSSFALLITVSLFSATSFATQPNLGTEISVLPTAIMKDITYAYDADWSWSMAVETSPKLSSNDLSAQGMLWSAFDSKAGKYLFDWKPVQPISPLFNIKLDSAAEVAAFLPIQKQLQIVIAQANGTPAFFLDLGKFCGQYPEKVTNLTNLSGKACEAEGLQPPQDACKEFGDYLDSLIKKGLLTCKVAEKQYVKGSPNFPDAVNCPARKFCH